MYAEYLGLQYDVLEAGTGGEAIRQMTSRRPDVVVTDVSLPDFDGFELVSRLRRQEALASIPVIGLSGYGGYAHEQRAREVGCALLLQKPCLPDTLANAVAEVLGASLARRRK